MLMMSSDIRPVLRTACFFLVAVLTACGAETQVPNARSIPAGPAGPAQTNTIRQAWKNEAVLPPGPGAGLPEPASLDHLSPGRGASHCDFVEQSFSAAPDMPLMQNGTAVIDDVAHTISLPSTAGEATWSIYRFGPLADPAGSHSGFIRIGLQDLAGTPIYVGFGDFTSQRWRFSKIGIPIIGSASYSLGFDSTADMSSPDGYFYVAILTYDGFGVTVNSLEYFVGMVDISVAQFAAADGGSQDSVQLSWAALPGALGYDICIREVLDPENKAEVQIDSGAATNFVHNAANVPELPPAANSSYNYSIRGIYEMGQLSLMASDPGYTSLPAPDVIGGYLTNNFKIVLRWDPVPGATGYQITRLEGLEQVLKASLNLGETQYESFEEIFDNDYNEYQYFVRPVDANGPSLNAGTATTRLLKLDVFNVGTGFNLQGEIAAALLDDKPAFLAYESDSNNALFIQAESALPLTGTDFTSYIFDIGSARGDECSLAEVDGFPAVAMQPASAAPCRYGYADSVSPTAPANWFVSNAVSDEGVDHISLVDAGGLPVVFYSGDGAMYCASPADSTPQGPQDWEDHIVDPSAGYGGCKLLYDGQRLMATYWHPDNEIRFAYTEVIPPTNSADWTITGVATERTNYLSLDMALDAAGIPAIVYCNYDNMGPSGELRFARALTMPPAGPADWLDQVACSQPDVLAGAYPKISYRNGRPVILDFLIYPGNADHDVVLVSAMRDLPEDELDWDLCSVHNGLAGIFGSTALLNLDDGRLAGGYDLFTGDGSVLSYFYEVQN